MPSKAPPNIMRLVRENDKYTSAEAYAKDLDLGNQNSTWHQKTFQKSGCRPPETAQAHAEVAEANKALKLMRKERLRQLLMNEKQEYERELHAMGLALGKRID
eukprot:TRINITY_DN7450_c0_g2_i1.p3 TRINITY_DN7450_c0_g2~~TRINITY_DN7450_c0_g2_i1.p3  ORF type:complete len:103 (-),score=28.44 TRINITY_DN7450_c0_g2_i1:246-554(-)